MDLFSSEQNTNPIHLDLPDASIMYYPHFISEKKSDTYFDALFKKTPWQEDAIKIFGNVYKQPRLPALYGEKGKSYTYSGITMQPLPFTPLLKEIKNKIEAITKETFNTVLLNLYRTGQDSNGWHSDDEKELGKNPSIASVSFGAERMFQLKHKKNKNVKHKLKLENGSLLLMKGQTQHFWKHQVPKTKKNIAPRINLTFRKIITP